jgi:hypothetical protein
VIDKLLSYMILLMVPEQVRDCQCCSNFTCLCIFCFSFLDLSLLYFCFFPVLKSLSGSLSLIYNEKFQPCSGFLDREYGDFLMLTRVTNYKMLYPKVRHVMICGMWILAGGCPVVKGNKWSATKWLHVEKYSVPA